MHFTIPRYGIATTTARCDRYARPKSNRVTIARNNTCDKLSTSDEGKEVAA